MLHDKYKCLANETYASFIFESVGVKGKIKKSITYHLLRWLPNGIPVYNLGFGDWSEVSQQVDDSIVSNNGDRDKVLATVASTILVFCEKHGRAAIYAEGSSPSKTRLYQMAINAHLEEVQMLFNIFGLVQDKWVVFEPGVNYAAFLVIKK